MPRHPRHPQRPRRLWLLATVVTTLLLILGASPTSGRARPAEGVELRGRIVRMTPSGAVPAGGVPVTFSREGGGRSAPVVTGPTGWYGFVEIRVGTVVVEAWPYGMPAGPQAAPVQHNVNVQATSGMMVLQDISIP